MFKHKTAFSLAVGSAFISTIAVAPLATAADNPFELESLNNGYQVIAQEKEPEGKCGEGRCGGGSAKEKTKKPGARS